MGQEKSSLNQMQTADGRNRTWMQMVPANRHDDPRARPLVVMLHGAGGSAGRVIGATRWDEVAEREGFAESTEAYQSWIKEMASQSARRAA